MERIRTEILPGVWLTALRTDKFKTAWLSVNLLTQLRRSTAACTAVLPYVLRRGSTHTLLELWLETGRTHQIRVHMAHLGCPVEGDFLYGTENPSRPGFALHAWSLTLRHPLTAEKVTACAPMPAWFGELLEK